MLRMLLRGLSFHLCILSAFSLLAFSTENPDNIHVLKLFELINQTRASYGLNRLKYSDTASKIAYLHSLDMMNNSFISHVSSDGKTTEERILSEDKLFTISLGENVARDSSIEGAHTALMNSAGHRKNILASDWTHIGLGIATGKDGLFYITENFIRLPSIYEFEDMKMMVMDRFIRNGNFKYSTNLELYARSQTEEYIRTDAVPSVSASGGFRKISQTAFTVSRIEDTFSEAVKESGLYTYLGFYAVYRKETGSFARLYTVYLFASY